MAGIRRRVAELGIRSQIAIRLRVNGRRRAVLNLYGREPGAVTGHHDLVELFVTHSALAIDFGEAIDQLSDALRSRKMIGQALGLVMGQYGMTEEQAFAYVRRISQDRNVKLRDVCVALVAEFDAARRAAVDGNERPTAQAARRVPPHQSDLPVAQLRRGPGHGRVVSGGHFEPSSCPGCFGALP